VGAVRRAPQRERDYIDPPGHAERGRWVDEEEAQRRALAWAKAIEIVATGTWVAFCVLFSIVICKWWGLL